MKLIDRDKVVAEIRRRQKIHFNDYHINGNNSPADYGACNALTQILDFIGTLEVKDDSLEKFKSLQHISGDLHQTLEDWGYAPNLYYFDGSWHVDWISCEEGDSIKGFTEDTAEEAINKAYNWFHSTFCNS